MLSLQGHHHDSRRRVTDQEDYCYENSVSVAVSQWAVEFVTRWRRVNNA